MIDSICKTVPLTFIFLLTGEIVVRKKIKMWLEKADYPVCRESDSTQIGPSPTSLITILTNIKQIEKNVPSPAEKKV